MSLAQQAKLRNSNVASRTCRATLELIEAELPERARFAAVLDVPVPADWPPGLNDARSQQYMIDRLRREGETDFKG